MIVADRLRSTLAKRNISQAELARRVGVSQQTIAKLVGGSAYNSRYLHKIARELATTPAYLTGETDDPENNGPRDQFTAEERDWVDLLRNLGPADRKAALQLVRTIAHSARSPTLQVPGADYRGEGQ
ncbi:helix-turn-helix domain-containing protein [Novosphingobium album (ex Liu et al. 2023)]|uniref:Helix-turn-helix transcriptional regulator n=1 Tax=Novosphingobium album (ex Liu et al. 2023) TaxID=3031130 RepID=A0ABT5WN41_9SPHN|nr:helix-turn-helix transcriptional regulator [Novosphingobium album (ex Liu et al. 2023)]MDE8651469.1 helix-turn-helix transcriptional regulator [Novosphingobium album (ex Liu et al. 2023)]